MSLFDSLFGKKKPASVSAPQPAAPASAPAPPADAKNQTKYRMAQCDLCSSHRNAQVTDDGQFIGQIVVVATDPKAVGGAFVGACPTCDIDVCGGCARWVKDTSMLDELLKADRPAAEREMTIKMWGNSFRATCPRCNGEFVGKTAQDVKRIQDGLQELTPFGAPGQESRRQQLARRLVRICTEEEPVFTKLFPPGEFEKLRMHFMRMANT